MGIMLALPAMRLSGATLDKPVSVATLLATFGTLLVVAMGVAVASDTWLVPARAVSVAVILPFKEVICSLVDVSLSGMVEFN